MATSLQNGIAAAKSGDKKLALQHIQQAIKENPRDVTAWLWASVLVNDIEKKRLCLNKALEIDPQNQNALREMAKLSQKASSQNQTSKPTPVVSEKPNIPSPVQAQPVRKNRPPSTQPPKKQKKKMSLWTKIGFWLTILYFGVSMIILPLAALSSPEGLQGSSELPPYAYIMILFGGLVGFHYIISGYMGAYKLYKSSPSLSCMTLIFFGWIILIVPWFLGWLLLWWGNRVERKNAEKYKQCSDCQILMPANVMYCPSCGQLV